MTAVVEHRPAPTAALLRQGVRHHRPDRVLPVKGRRNVRRLVRCFVSQPGTGNQALAQAGSPNASRSKGFCPETLVEKRKRAAGIEPASSAWKAEVLPLNYARKNCICKDEQAPGLVSQAQYPTPGANPDQRVPAPRPGPPARERSPQSHGLAAILNTKPAAADRIRVEKSLPSGSQRTCPASLRQPRFKHDGQLISRPV